MLAGGGAKVVVNGSGEATSRQIGSQSDMAARKDRRWPVGAKAGVLAGAPVVQDGDLLPGPVGGDQAASSALIGGPSSAKTRT
jgi:hypothetical protein